MGFRLDLRVDGDLRFGPQRSDGGLCVVGAFFKRRFSVTALHREASNLSVSIPIRAANPPDRFGFGQEGPWGLQRDRLRVSSIPQGREKIDVCRCLGAAGPEVHKYAELDSPNRTATPYEPGPQGHGGSQAYGVRLLPQVWSALRSGPPRRRSWARGDRGLPRW